MNDRYRPNGKPLTEREREILTVLIDECGEVIQSATKLLRFGKENRPDTGKSNTDVLSEECGDLRYLLTMVRDADLTDAVVERQAAERKHDRMRWYMQTSADITHARIR
jgi:hypothetical protein